MAKRRIRTKPALARAKGIQVSIPDDLRKANQAVRLTLVGCRKTTADHNDMLRYSGRPGIELRVTRQQLRRAMQIAQGFIDAVVARGHRAVLAESNDGEVELLVNGAILGFSITESLREVPTKLDSQGKQLYRTEATGALSLHMFSRPKYMAHGRTHRDGRTYSLESRLALAIPDLEAMAERAFVTQQAERERERRWQHEEHRRKCRSAADDRRRKIQSALQAVVADVRLAEEARRAAQRLREGSPQSRWAQALAKWIDRAERKLGSPRRIARNIPVEIWAALGMPTSSKK